LVKSPKDCLLRKNAEKLPKLYIGFSAFFLWSPLGNNEKKSYLNKLKF
jgi:hypothetical protein